jgi:hypothetical protein
MSWRNDPDYLEDLRLEYARDELEERIHDYLVEIGDIDPDAEAD